MSKIKSLDDVKHITVHWSESSVINDELGCDDNCDIEKVLLVDEFSNLLKLAEKEITSGYDKTSLTVTLENDTQWCFESKFYICKGDSDLLAFLNKGQ